jgi:hypothetical protein
VGPPAAPLVAPVGPLTGPATPAADPPGAAPAEHGRLETPTGFRAVLDAARSSTALFLLAGAAALFLLVQGRWDRRSPGLADAPVDRRAEMLEFS